MQSTVVCTHPALLERYVELSRYQVTQPNRISEPEHISSHLQPLELEHISSPLPLSGRSACIEREAARTGSTHMHSACLCAEWSFRDLLADFVHQFEVCVRRMRHH